MIKFNASFVLAVKFLNVLYKSDGIRPVRLEDVDGANIHFLGQVARKLRMSKIVKSVRGPGGGYLLTTKEVSAYDLHKALKLRDADYTGTNLHVIQSNVVRAMQSASIFE